MSSNINVAYMTYKAVKTKWHFGQLQTNICIPFLFKHKRSMILQILQFIKHILPPGQKVNPQNMNMINDYSYNMCTISITV